MENMESGTGTGNGNGNGSGIYIIFIFISLNLIRLIEGPHCKQIFLTKVAQKGQFKRVPKG